MTSNDKFIKSLNKKLTELTGTQVVLKETKPYRYSCIIVSPDGFGVFSAVFNHVEISGYIQPGTRDEDEFATAHFDLNWNYKSLGSNGTTLMTAQLNLDNGAMRFWNSDRKEF